MNSQQILDREFLEVRAKVLEIAAALDRIERGESDGTDIATDPRMKLLRESIDVIAADHSEAARAEQVQLLFSKQYDESWKQDFKMNR